MAPVLGKTPGGMTISSWQKFNQHVDFNAFRRLGFVETKWGTVYLAEHFDSPGWTILWAARDMFCRIECNEGSSQHARKQAALNHAFDQLVTREEVFREL